MSKRGRPPGSPNVSTTVRINASACKVCGCTETKGYVRKCTLFEDGVREGQRYNLVVRRQTACKSCGAKRIDEWYEFHVSGNRKTVLNPNGVACENAPIIR